MASAPNGIVAVSAIGMVSSLGGNAVISCAAARAGLSRAAELKMLDFQDGAFGAESADGPPVVFGHEVRGVADGFTGIGKALLFGKAAIDDLLANRPLTESERARTGLIVNLSDHFVLDADARERKAQVLPSTAWQERTRNFHYKLAQASKLPSDPATTRLHHGGNAGMAAAIDEASALIASQQVDRCIVGAIDSRVEPSFLKAAAELRQLRTNDNPAGQIPGEAAAFLLLERPAEVGRAGVRSLGTVATAATARDEVDLLSAEHAPTGVALAEVLRKALGSAQVGFTIGDHDGASRRAVEWGCALVLLRGTPIDDLPTWLPAVSFGATGAAAGAVGLCVAARAFARGYAPGQSALVWLSSESGQKAAILFHAPGQAGARR